MVSYRFLLSIVVLVFSLSALSSEYYWENGFGKGSKYYWENGFGKGSKYYWENGSGKGSERYWENGFGKSIIRGSLVGSNADIALSIDFD